MERKYNLYGQHNLHTPFCTVKRKCSFPIVCLSGNIDFFMLYLGENPFLYFGPLLYFGTVITFGALILGPKCINGFITITYI